MADTGEERRAPAEKSMSLVDHLDELRARLIRGLLAAFIGMIVAYCIYDPWILNLLRGPLDELSGRTENPFVFGNPLLALLRSATKDVTMPALNLHFIGAPEVFLVKIKASFFAGAILAFPFILYQVWMFVAAGLKNKERRTIRFFFPVALGLFALGLVVAYVIMLPMILYFLVVVSAQGLQPTLVLSKYVSLVVAFCLAAGVVFEMPLVVFVLAKLGIVTPASLVRSRKYALLLMFVVAAMLTPPDVITQLMLALPMLVLYEIGIVFARFAAKRR